MLEKPFEESWFYAPLTAIGDRAEFSRQESHHLRKVLRLPMGGRIIASNGKGRVFLCETRSKGESVEAAALEILFDAPRPPRLHMVLALLKGRDIEEPVEGLCQLSIAAIHLVTTDHTQEFKSQDHSKAVERLRVKSMAAMKQAKKPWLTLIHEPRPLKDWRENKSGPIILVHPGSDRIELPEEGDFHLLVGPEGGFSGREIEWLKSMDCCTLGLGQTRIRGTHAPLLACGKLMGLGLL